jgi:hypothetical protein
VEERPGDGGSPVEILLLPPRAALGWLETSIRSYAKYVDVAAKVSGDGDDESEVMNASARAWMK